MKYHKILAPYWDNGYTAHPNVPTQGRVSNFSLDGWFWSPSGPKSSWEKSLIQFYERHTPRVYSVLWAPYTSVIPSFCHTAADCGTYRSSRPWRVRISCWSRTCLQSHLLHCLWCYLHPGGRCCQRSSYLTGCTPRCSAHDRLAGAQRYLFLLPSGIGKHCKLLDTARHSSCLWIVFIVS